MNSTISLSQIITRLSKATGADTNTCRLFVREFFASATSALAADSTVEIKGVGTFRRSTQADENGNFAVQFIPDATVADEANRAFSKPWKFPQGSNSPTKQRRQPYPNRSKCPHRHRNRRPHQLQCPNTWKCVNRRQLRHLQ